MMLHAEQRASIFFSFADSTLHSPARNTRSTSISGGKAAVRCHMPRPGTGMVELMPSSCGASRGRGICVGTVRKSARRWQAVRARVHPADMSMMLSARPFTHIGASRGGFVVLPRHVTTGPTHRANRYHRQAVASTAAAAASLNLPKRTFLWKGPTGETHKINYVVGCTLRSHTCVRMQHACPPPFQP